MSIIFHGDLDHFMWFITVQRMKPFFMICFIIFFCLLAHCMTYLLVMQSRNRSCYKLHIPSLPSPRYLWVCDARSSNNWFEYIFIYIRIIFEMTRTAYDGLFIMRDTFIWNCRIKLSDNQTVFNGFSMNINEKCCIHSCITLNKFDGLALMQMFLRPKWNMQVKQRIERKLLALSHTISCGHEKLPYSYNNQTMQ